MKGKRAQGESNSWTNKKKIHSCWCALPTVLLVHKRPFCLCLGEKFQPDLWVGLSMHYGSKQPISLSLRSAVSHHMEQLALFCSLINLLSLCGTLQIFDQGNMYDLAEGGHTWQCSGTTGSMLRGCSWHYSGDQVVSDINLGLLHTWHVLQPIKLTL